MKKPPDASLIFAAALATIAMPVSSQEMLTLAVEPAPLAWGVAIFLALLLILLTGIMLTILKKSIGDEVKLQQTVKKSVEDSYARKVRLEYQAKQALLDKKLDQVRQRFSMVMMKVKNLLDTLDPEHLFKAISDLVEADIGANRYIVFLIDPVKNELYPFRWLGYSSEIQKVLFMPVESAHILTYAIKRRQSVFRANAITDIEVRKLLDRKPVSNTLVAIPLISRDKSYGVVHIESFADGHTELDDSETRFLAALPTFIGGALANADIFVQTREELTSARKITEQEIAEKRRLHDIFSRYTSAELVENLMKSPDKIDLGGVNKTAAIMFSDIAGFTAFSAKFSPKEVVNLMNEYLSRMTEVILDHQGEIDKFIGDAIMARFGVLSDLPYPARNAVEAACAMLEELDRLRSEWAARGLENFNIRIGIATGPVLAGNIGSARRQEFTVMGTTVNLASRLEALNKETGSRILVDEETFSHLPKGLKFVKRENQRIRGLTDPLTVYEIHELNKGAKVISLQSKIDQNQNQNHQRPAPIPAAAEPTRHDLSEKP
ncbi:MAG TPA: adenylate/guanylate cyclase domain-containing protein [Candidatus Rifleibacterium sp.]|nr:adenylate/guanylate cyclase domain-containing protein [Candidatus Rifleibacterium sp.]HPT45482.1 adenylate/guanylate cyclase domain-containing protein [Candidatus Rifleibacterium sp.]